MLLASLAAGSCAYQHHLGAQIPQCIPNTSSKTFTYGICQLTHVYTEWLYWYFQDFPFWDAIMAVVVHCDSPMYAFAIAVDVRMGSNSVTALIHLLNVSAALSPCRMMIVLPPRLVAALLEP